MRQNGQASVSFQLRGRRTREGRRMIPEFPSYDSGERWRGWSRRSRLEAQTDSLWTLNSWHLWVNQVDLCKRQSSPGWGTDSEGSKRDGKWYYERIRESMRGEKTEGSPRAGQRNTNLSLTWWLRKRRKPARACWMEAKGREFRREWSTRSSWRRKDKSQHHVLFWLVFPSGH